ncbi:hypothetical protein ACN4EG_14500 [Alkalinema pantanalense CENA528]|uniref:hypothetical protein n=1 Tax=Alkalinema pantanalense TaxID=1620705 RepID=UPI003D6FDEEE
MSERMLTLPYLQEMQGYALVPGMVNFFELNPDRLIIFDWIQANIQQVNHQLQQYLYACHACFNPDEQPALQIFGVPLSPYFGVDAFCNFSSQPMTILIDVGRVEPHLWLGLVAHEYAHAKVGLPGHDRAFAEVLNHLCLGLGLPCPGTTEAQLKHYPGGAAVIDAIAFWRGSPGYSQSTLAISN